MKHAVLSTTDKMIHWPSRPPNQNLIATKSLTFRQHRARLTSANGPNADAADEIS